jgi:NADH-quinone oxidoreductase subunit L
MIETFPWIILFLPLLATGIITVLTHERPELSARISIAAVVVGFWLSCIQLLDPHAFLKPLELTRTWLSVGNLNVDFGLRLDRLSLLMLVVVTGVGGAIHIYSYEYMREDRSVPRYFAQLSLFTFSMLGLVLANNFLMMFIFWELVGISSYLLIGFWYEKPSAADAGKKAFLVNRLGDTGFLLGILLLWATLGSLKFDVLELALKANPAALGALASVAGVLIFCGAVGKSAQFPLHVWLPDAMEGPTPVSALIHAATMVAAGVYMLCRAFFLFTATPQWPQCLSFLDGITALDIIAWIGGITALLSALMAIQQNDIKRILAYSTLSQLGYMVMAVGLSGPQPAMFHLTTHAGFKALLFLGAGSVIYALHHEQDIWKMGGLKNKMAWTYWMFLFATLALAGVPPFSGFYSKDAILAQALSTDHRLLFLVAVFVAALTAFYMFRLVYVVFLGTPHVPGAGHAKESPSMMTQPMMFLTMPTLFAGLWGLDQFLGLQFEPAAAGHSLPWYQSLFAPFEHAPVAAFSGLAACALGWLGAWGLYRGAKKDPLPAMLGGFSQAMRDRFYIDEIYERTFIRAQDVLAACVAGFDRYIVSGVCIRGLHGGLELSGRFLRLFQTGNLQTYAFLMVVGVIVLIYFAVVR